MEVSSFYILYLGPKYLSVDGGPVVLSLVIFQILRRKALQLSG